MTQFGLHSEQEQARIDAYWRDAHQRSKSAGQIAYEADCAAMPNYPHNGKRRVTWAKLPAIAQDSWERPVKP